MTTPEHVGRWHLPRILVGTAVALFALLMVTAASTSSIQAAAGEVLILDTSVNGGLASPEAVAVSALGKTPVLVTGAQWSAMTAQDFASYDAIVLGDPFCSTNLAGSVGAAEANANVWGPEIDGNVLIVGTDPVLHSKTLVTENGIAFATAVPGKTGAYITLSCYYHFAAVGTSVPLLEGLSGGGFEIVGASFIGGLNNVHIVASHPALSGMTDAYLSNWGNSVHEGFQSWPLSFEVLALAVDNICPFIATDGTQGCPHILARGEGLTIISDIALSPETATNALGETHTLTALVTDDSGSSPAPVVGTDVTFTVISGPHAGTTGVDATDGAGAATFSYVGTAVGIDTIEATFVDGGGRTQRSNRVAKEWVEGTPVSPTLTLIKHVINDDGGTENASAWTLRATGAEGSFSGNGSPTDGTEATLGPNDVTAGVEYTLSESGPGGYASTGIWSCVGDGSFVAPEKITLAAGESATCTITNDDNPVVEPTHGRMTGGGSAFTAEGRRVTHGFNLNCDAAVGGNLQVNWGRGNTFHLQTLASAVCSENDAIYAGRPAVGFNTYEGSGTGTYNGVAGATATWTFTDAGEPGAHDSFIVTIVDADSNVVLVVDGTLTGGNHQAHPD